MSFERPPEPPDFQERVSQAKRAVVEARRAGELPVFTAGDAALWQAYKDHFARAQWSKCAFCEMSIVNHDSAVDHFAPKGEVAELSENEAERGQERKDGLPNMGDRKAARAIRPGYWWLAYEWCNYLVVCSACNEKWKRCYFPVEATPRQWPPSPEVAEAPLLLNPFDDPAPWRHFRFDEFGYMVAAPNKIRGQATLETLGFDTTADGRCRREALRLRRIGPAADAHRHARAFVRFSLQGSYEQAMYALENLYHLGGPERDHAGMVRAIAEHVTGFTWDELMTFRSLDGGAPAASTDSST
jgi:hypothetical protein